MTPDHQKLIEQTLAAASTRATELATGMAVPLASKTPYTRDMMWASPLSQDLQAIANYVEGYPVEATNAIASRIVHVLFGQILSTPDVRLPRDFHKTALGKLLNDAYVKHYPADAWMRTVEVQKLFGVKRQTVYDWIEEGKLAAYQVNGVQMFRRKYVIQFHEGWLRRKKRKQQASEGT